jgi:hypothetical protein
LRFDAVAPPAPAVKRPRSRGVKPNRKNDPKLVAAARELRDRYLEHVNAGGMALEGEGKYDLTRALPASPAAAASRQLGPPSLLLPAA